MRLRLIHLYGDLMNLYGDRGNILSLQRRCAWRQIELEVAEVSIGDRVDPTTSDIFFFGGGQDREQETVSRDLATGNGEAIREAVEDGAALLAVCGGYQLLGRFFRTSDGVEIPGTGLFDAHTVRRRRPDGRQFARRRGPRTRLPLVLRQERGGVRASRAGLPLLPQRERGGVRASGPGVWGQSPQWATRWLGSRTTVGKPTWARAQPRSDASSWETGTTARTGSRALATVPRSGTYLHGPALPKNPWLTDWLILAALQRRLGADAALPELDDGRELAAHRAVADRVRREGNVRTSIR